MNTQVLAGGCDMSSDSRSSVDTTFVMFFLAMEFGRTVMKPELDGILLGAALAMLMVVPYFMGTEARPALGRWLAGRGLIAFFAAVLGAAFQTTLGTVIPEEFRYMPMTLLIGTAMVSCYIQFYGFMKFRVAK